MPNGLNRCRQPFVRLTHRSSESQRDQTDVRTEDDDPIAGVGPHRCRKSLLLECARQMSANYWVRVEGANSRGYFVRFENHSSQRWFTSRDRHRAYCFASVEDAQRVVDQFAHYGCQAQVVTDRAESAKSHSPSPTPQLPEHIREWADKILSIGLISGNGSSSTSERIKRGYRIGNTKTGFQTLRTTLFRT